MLGLNSQIQPIAPAMPDTIRHLDSTIIDNWAWMKNRDNPLLHKHLQAEERYCTSKLKQSGKLANKIMKEFVAQIPKLTTSSAYEDNGYLYYSRSYKNKAYPVHYRKATSPNAKEQVLMDENKLARGKKYFALGIFAISPDASKLAYSVDYHGDEIYELYIKDIKTNKAFNTGISGISDYIWQEDNRHAIITMQNDRLQVDSCYRLDTYTRKQIPLYNESDPAFDLGLYHSSNDTYIILLASSKNTCESSYLKSSNLSGSFELILARKPGHQYYPDILDNKLYLHTNFWDADFSYAYTDIAEPDIGSWKQLIAPQSDSPLGSVLLFNDYIVANRRVNGFERIQIYSRIDNSLLHEIIPDSPSDLSFWYNPKTNASAFTYALENELTPYSIYSYSFADHSSNMIYQSQTGSKYKHADYISKTVYVQTADGVSIPLSLIHRKDLDTSRPQALWLSAYGAYGDTNDPYFSTLHFPILDRNVIMAVAHVRGGGEYGQSWYDAGRLLNKQNSFTDFIACLCYIVDKGISIPDKIVIEGGSAGGLLVGAVSNLRPDLMKLVIADVPFVDMTSTMLDDSLPLTLQEYEEWGNPNDPMVFEYMKQYCPYNNVRPAHYPAMLISAAWFDTRVGYWEALKWAQKLRTNNLGQNPIVFRMLYHEGHTGSNDRYRSLKSYADTYAYVLSLIR